MADEQFPFANNKWDVTKNNNNKLKQQKNKRKQSNKETNNNNKTQKYEQLLENSQNKL